MPVQHKDNIRKKSSFVVTDSGCQKGYASMYTHTRICMYVCVRVNGAIEDGNRMTFALTRETGIDPPPPPLENRVDNRVPTRMPRSIGCHGC